MEKVPPRGRSEPLWLVASRATAANGGDSITSEISSQLPPLEIAGVDAARAIARLATEILPGAWSEPAFGEELARTDSRTWIAWDPEAARGQVAGFLILRLGPEAGEILSVGVAIHWRRRGLARFLVEAAVSATRASNLRQVDLELRASNESALDLYQSLGFVVVGRRPRYYRGGEDAILMTREID